MPLAQARLGETEDQTEDRYGIPKRQFEYDDNHFPLVRGDGARTKSYIFQSYRIRVGYLNGVTVRIEYLRQNGLPDPVLKDFEKAAIFEGETVGGKWHPDAPGQGQVVGFVPGQTRYLRDDGARAVSNTGNIIFDSKAFLDLEAARKAEAQKAQATRQATVDQQRRDALPKF